MVVSRLNKNITYPELKHIDKEDISKCADIYEVELDQYKISKITVVISIGNVKTKFANKQPGILYFPIYLITKNKSAVQIGVYEIFQSDLYKFVDKDIDTNINHIKNYELFDPPLLWSWVDNRFIIENRLSPTEIDRNSEEEEVDTDEDSNEEDNNTIIYPPKTINKMIPPHRSDIFSVMHDVKPLEFLKEETPEYAALIKKDNQLNWISKFMKNENYDFDNKDNIFHIIQSAFEQIGQQTYEKKMRKKLSDSKFIEPYFYRQKMAYNELVKSIQQLQKKMEIEEHKKDELKKTLKQKKANGQKFNESEMTEYNKMKQSISDMTIQQEELKKMRKKMDFMKNIDDATHMKNYMMTKQFELDEKLIFILEQLLKIKFIFFIEDANKENDLKGAIDCGEKEDSVGKYQPEFYILCNYSETKNKYSIVSYKNRRIFTFQELPYELKKIISYKCIEKVGGIFSRIPEWILFAQKNANYHDTPDERLDIEDISYPDKIMRKYDGVKIMIYCPSSHTKFPGTVRGEIMPFEKKQEYILLSTMDNWRCILDNNWTGTDLNEKGILKNYQFELNGYYWASVQHYIQACKFKEDNPAFYSKFALGSSSKSDINYNIMDGLSNNVKLAIFLGTKPAGKMYKGDPLDKSNGYKRDQHIQIDMTYNNNIEKRNLKDALYAKFSQNPTFKKILLLTHQSLLVYAPLKKTEYHAEELMSVRDILAG